MITPNPKFRPNPKRAIYIDGLIDDHLVSRLTPQILHLLHESRDPITAYILSSPGGIVAHMETILRLLQVADQDTSSSCHLITVVTTRAASAAADLLSAGDYAIAFPDSMILYHGIRTSLRDALTAESTSLLAHYLRMTNDDFAMDLARKIEMRFLFRYTILKNKFEETRAKNAHKEVSDLDCFLELIGNKLSLRAKPVFEKAKERFGRYHALLASAIKKDKEKLKGPKRLAELEARRIKAIVDFEVSANRHDPSWTFRDGGMTRLGDDFFLLNEYLESRQNQRFLRWCRMMGKLILDAAEMAEIEKISDEKLKNDRIIEKVQPTLEPIWSFFMALCHALQEGENELTATDAYWLGLVDEVMGSTLPNTRWIEEYTESPKAPDSGGDEAKAG